MWNQLSRPSTADLQQTMTRSCPACHVPGGSPAVTVGGFPVRACGHCGSFFTTRLPTAQESHDYGSYYHVGNLEVTAFLGMRLDEHVRSHESYSRFNRRLDIGCGAGTLLHSARRNSWLVTGTEVAPVAAEHLRSQGLDVRCGELDALDLPTAGFDVVSLVEVIEHVPEPDALLGAAVQLVRPGGAVYVTTPHARGLSGRLLGTDWDEVSPPEHLQLYSVKGLRIATRRSGLLHRAIRTHGVNPRALIADLRRRDGDQGGENPVESGYRLNEKLESSRIGSAFKLVANATLSATRLGDGLKMVAERPSRSAGGAYLSPVLDAQEGLQGEQRP